MSPAEEHLAMLNSMPSSSNARKGLITELCSMLEVTTWSPGFKNPRNIVFKPSVALRVKITVSGSSAPIIDAIVSRVLKIIRLASTESLWPERPGFAPTPLLKSIIACIITSGFGHDVAALSKYIGFIIHSSPKLSAHGYISLPGIQCKAVVLCFLIPNMSH
jgi:hypothetical protein